MGKGVMLKGRENENIYPVTSSDLVYDPITKTNIKNDLAGKVEEAPQDDKQYARINGAWAEVEAGAVSETALITLTPAVSELNGVSIKVTTNEGETLLDSTWNGSQLAVQVKAGLQYTVAVGEKEGFITPESVTYTAVKGVTRTIDMSYIESRLVVGILSNQGEDETIAAVKATVSYGGTSVQVANGGSVSLPLNVDVTITFPAVDGYKTPDAITYNHTSGSYEKSGTYQTELVNVTLSADNGESVAGQIVTINGTAHTWNGATISQKIPFGTTYEVSVNDKDGYTTPSAQSYTAAKSVRDLALLYEEIKLGVYIQGVSGKLYTADEWSEQETVNGIAVLTENTRLVMKAFSSDDTYEDLVYQKFGLYNVDIEGVPIRSDINDVITDFNGYENTEIIIAKYTREEAPAAWYCKSFLFPDTKHYGYLLSAGELNDIHLNIKSIENAYSALDVSSYYTFIPTLTSTPASLENVWGGIVGNTGETSIREHGKSITFNTIPVCRFE